MPDQTSAILLHKMAARSYQAGRRYQDWKRGVVMRNTNFANIAKREMSYEEGKVEGLRMALWLLGTGPDKYNVVMHHAFALGKADRHDEWSEGVI